MDIISPDSGIFFISCTEVGKVLVSLTLSLISICLSVGKVKDSEFYFLENGLFKISLGFKKLYLPRKFNFNSSVSYLGVPPECNSLF